LHALRNKQLTARFRHFARHRRGARAARRCTRIHDETTGTLFCGDLLGQTGNPPALVHDADIVGAALEAEDMFHATCLTADTAPTVRRLAQLAPHTLALMHGPAYAGDGAAALECLAEGYAELFAASQREVVVR
jgi:flavorubredoxin